MRTVTGFCALAALGLAAPSAQVVAQSNPLGFSVDVKLSPKAAAKLAGLGEKIVVAAIWSGEPLEKFTKQAKKFVAEDGSLFFGVERVTIPGADGHADFSGKTVKLEHVDWVKDQTPEVLINVYTARLKTADNLLDCGVFQDQLSAARAKTIQIACKLIGER